MKDLLGTIMPVLHFIFLVEVIALVGDVRKYLQSKTRANNGL